jgi:hypothetical protein
MRAIPVVLCVLFLCACGPGDDEMVIVLKNESKMDLFDFVLDTGSGRIQRTCLANGQTIEEVLPILRSASLTLTCDRGGGNKIEKDLEWTVGPEHNGGRLRITFRPWSKEDIAFDEVR